MSVKKMENLRLCVHTKYFQDNASVCIDTKMDHPVRMPTSSAVDQRKTNKIHSL